VVGDLTNRTLLKKDLVVGYEHKDYSAYLKGIQAWDRQTRNFNNWRELFSTISLTGLYRRNLRELLGVEANFNPESNKLE